MVRTSWFPSGAALLSRYECVLLQVGTRPDMTLDVKQQQTNNKSSH